MNAETFTNLVTRRLEAIKSTLTTKGAEYAPTSDRLHNFKTVAVARGQTPAQALWGMYMKHWCSVQDAVEGRTQPTQDWIDEKIGDSIVYHILLEAVFVDMYSQQRTTHTDDLK